MVKRIFQVVYMLLVVFLVIGFFSSMMNMFENFKRGVDDLGVILGITCIFFAPTYILQYIIYGILDPLFVFRKDK